MNWGDNLTLMGAVRLDGLGRRSARKWGAMNKATFITWVRDRLAPRLRRGDIVVLDNLQAHKAPVVQFFDRSAGRDGEIPAALLARFQSDRTRLGSREERHQDFCPAHRRRPRRVARAARHVVTPDHCRQFFAHAGYVNSSACRD